MDHPNLTRVPGFADTFNRLSKVQEAVDKNSAVREYFNVYGIISAYKCERGKKRLVIRDEENSDISISLSWKKGVIWNPDRKNYSRDDFEIGDVVRIMKLCVESGTCLINTVKQLSVMKSFSKSGTFDCRTQGVEYVRFDQFDKTRSQQLIKFLSNEITSCRFCDIPPEKGIRSFCGRVTSTAVTPEGHQIICLSDGTRPVIKSHSVTGQKYLMSSGRSKGETASEYTLQLTVTDAVSTDQAVTPDDVIVVFNANFEHQPESGLTLITTNRNKKYGKAVSVICFLITSRISGCLMCLIASRLIFFPLSLPFGLRSGSQIPTVRWDRRSMITQSLIKSGNQVMRIPMPCGLQYSRSKRIRRHPL